MDILKKSLEEWKMMENIERAELEVNELIQKYDGKIMFENDLQRYASAIRETVQVLMKC
jgi:hypothetical protein